VARKYFVAENMTVVEVYPRSAPAVKAATSQAAAAGK
jgi:hypothetical protein